MSLAQRVHIIPTPLLLAVIVLSTAPVFKVGDVQGVELLLALRVAIAVILFAHCGLTIPIHSLWRQYASRYALFLAICFALAVFAMRLPFYPIPETSLLKQPLLVSLSRLFEMSLVMYTTVAVVETLAGVRELLRVAIDAYWLAGSMGAFLGIAGFLFLKMFGISTFVVGSATGRVTGLFNEGGPFGIFLVSVILVLLVRDHYFPFRFRCVKFTALFGLISALVLSGSKAGLMTGLSVCLVALTSAGRWRQRLIILSAFAVGAGLMFICFEGQLVGYVSDYSNFDDALDLRGADTNLIMGRVAGAIIVPRMLAAHPLSGLGIGNYSLMRNDPQYLNGLPAVDAWDLPGLGLLGTAAELGVPLTLFLIALLLMPFRQAKRFRMPGVTIATAAFQPIAALFGVNLNFLYPWVVTAFAIALIAMVDQGHRVTQ